ncbi:MAG TPA: GNAT family N-acetyltransferase, partial [Candidatus Acidoferrum sp.]|nr:GNAT family N-acetyltransferase [Candidatus Acidoferrum sp.]
MTDPARFAPPVDDLVFRGFRGIDADLPGMFEANRLGRMADGELEPIEYGGMRASYQHLERSDPSTDILVVVLGGEICGYARVEWADTNDGERTYNAIVALRPDARRREIRTGALRWIEARCRAIAAGHKTAPRDDPASPGDRRRWLTAFANDGDGDAGLLLEACGYRRHRRFYSMLRPDLEAIPELPLPEGLDVRPISRDRVAMWRVFEADTEAFRDHYGWVDDSEEAFLSFVDDPSTDPSLWVVAFDGDEVAGAVLNGIHQGHDGQTGEGWLDSVFTRRPWRRRGLARALIVRSLARLRERGVATAALGVDSENANQALS